MRHYTTGRLLVCLCLLLAGCGTSASQPSAKAPASTPDRTPRAATPVFDNAFWKQWGDGMAELCGYSLRYPRYGSVRTGTAVTIFVTETFSTYARVKADPGKHPPQDEMPVMKLNFIQDFQTGIYDYNTMLSSFIALKPFNSRPAGGLVKASYSSQEWCGQVWHQVIPEASRIRHTQHSYFDGEGDSEGFLDYPAGAISEDALLLWARGMAWPLLGPGEQKDVQMLASLEGARLRHLPLNWRPATLHRAPRPQSIWSPAGQFEVEMRTVVWQDGRRLAIGVEKAAPHRIIRWEGSDGWRGDLTGSKRLKYWEMNGPGFESALRELGVSPMPAPSSGKAN